MVRLLFLDAEDSLLALIDTGSNLLVAANDEIARNIGAKASGGFIHAELASGEIGSFRKAEATVLWFGAQRRVNIYIPVIREPTNPLGNPRRRPVGDGQPELLLGTELLQNCLLEIDFASKKVRLTKSVVD